MEAIGTIILFVSAVVMLVSAIWLLVVAFQNSLMWGLLCIFIPFASIIFAILNWDVAGRPMKYTILSTIGLFIGMAMAGTPAG